MSPEALEVLGQRPNLRLIVDRALANGRPSTAPPTSVTGLLRTAGGAVLVGEPDAAPDDPATWRVVSRRPPTEAERVDLDLAWRLVRYVTSNAVVLVRNRMLVGLGIGQAGSRQLARRSRRRSASTAPTSSAALPARRTPSSPSPTG
ncbi:MAG: hypothetical protein C4343_06160 [Chloroflexota bacterium]